MHPFRAEEVEIRSLWSPAESQLHINLLKLRTLLLALKAFLPSIKGRLVQVFVDNTTAIWYCNKQGRVGSWTLCQEALRLWTWLECQGIFLVVQHLPGSLNARVDEFRHRRLADRKSICHCREHAMSALLLI